MIGDNIRILRLERGFSIEELANAVGISVNAIEHYENNTWRPGVEVAARIADIFGITVMELVTGFSLLYDEATNKMHLIRHMGDNRIRTIKSFKLGEALWQKEVDIQCGNK
jgi:transcriptional regulator with XRE-family HTH domain